MRFVVASIVVLTLAFAHDSNDGVNDPENYAAFNGYAAKNERLMGREHIGLLVDGGWYPFQFGAVNTTSKDAFIFKTTAASSVLKITDNYCAGDSFYVFDNGEYLGATKRVSSNACRTNTTNPSVAWEDDSFSHGSWVLGPGTHKIQMTVAESPFMAGGGNIRVDSSLAGCPTHSPAGFHVIQSGVPFSAARQACASFGMDLADVDIYTFLEVTDLAFHCSGAFSQSWIGSYWGDSYGGSCLVLSTGNMAPGGAINVPADCNTARPVICKERTGYVPSSDYYSQKAAGPMDGSAATGETQKWVLKTDEQFWQDSYQAKDKKGAP
jgi:hypothetical protein